jgi:hypothetical protein
MHKCEKDLVAYLDVCKHTFLDARKRINENTYVECNKKYFRVINYSTELFRMYKRIDSRGNNYYIGHLRYVNTVTSKSRLRAILKWLYPTLSLPLDIIFEKSDDNMVTYMLTQDTLTFYTSKKTGALCYSITLNSWDCSRPTLEE